MSSHIGYKIFSGTQLFVIAMCANNINHIIASQTDTLKNELVEINKKLTEDLKQTQKQVQAQPRLFSLSWLCPWPGVADRSCSSKELK